MARLTFLILCAVCGFVALGFSANSASGQQATIAVPQTNVTNGFYEYYGINWGFRGNGFFFNNGGGGGFPQFGGFDPNAAANFGFGGKNFSFNFMAGQGSTRSNVSGTSMITLPNGGMGSVFDTSLRPFVVGVVPVVGMNVSSPLQERLHRLREGEQPKFPPGTFVRAPKAIPPQQFAEGQAPAEKEAPVAPGTAVPEASTATRGDLSVAEIRRQQAAQAAARDQELESLLEQARGQEELGKLGLAKLFYQQAARRATGDLQRQLHDKIRTLSGSTSTGNANK